MTLFFFHCLLLWNVRLSVHDRLLSAVEVKTQKSWSPLVLVSFYGPAILLGTFLSRYAHSRLLAWCRLLSRSCLYMLCPLCLDFTLLCWYYRVYIY